MTTTTKELLALVGRATALPWIEDEGCVRPAPESPDRVTVAYCSGEGSQQGTADARLIVAAVNALPALCAEVEAQDERIAQQDATIARMREALEKVSNYSTDKAREFDADFAQLHADHAACTACQEATKRSWPPSGLCNEHYGPFHKLIDRRNNAVESDDKWGRVDIARAALAALNQEQVK